MNLFKLKCLIFTLILLLMAMTQATAKAIDINANKFIQVYKKHFDKEICKDLFASNAEHKRSQKLRDSILDYLNNTKHKIPQQEIEKKWNQYIKNNFKSIKDMETKLENSYLSMDFVKKKFIQNLYFSDYFNTSVKSKIIEDIENRKKIIDLAKKQDIKLDKIKFQEKLLQMIENWGGEAKFKDFTARNRIHMDEIKFFIQSDLAKELLIIDALNQEIKNGNDKSNTIHTTINNYYYNHNENQSPNYYFRQAFVPIDDKSATAAIQSSYNHFSQTLDLEDYSNIPNSVKLQDMQVPINTNSELYLPQIKHSVMNLSKDGLFVSKKISPIISSEHGYHILQLTKVDVPNNTSIDEARDKILNKLMKVKAKEFNELFASN